MKYIRTKEKIYNTDDLRVAEYLTGTPYVVRNDGTCIYKNTIEREADTIEDLCDTFVFIVDQGKLVIDSFTKAKEYYNAGKKENMVFSLFGAIWTDKGLIYVAKMNDKGELELL